MLLNTLHIINMKLEF